jgi:hypothetical protein
MHRTKLCSTGNPDHGQYVAPSPSLTAVVNSIEEAVTACHEYISCWNLGSGNWYGEAGKVFNAGRLVATIAYNGRVCLV